MSSGIRMVGNASGRNNRLYGHSAMCQSGSMSTTAKPEPSPAEKFRQFAKQVLAVPKAEIERRDAEYKRQRGAAKAARP